MFLQPLRRLHLRQKTLGVGLRRPYRGQAGMLEAMARNAPSAARHAALNAHIGAVR